MTDFEVKDFKLNLLPAKESVEFTEGNFWARLFSSRYTKTSSKMRQVSVKKGNSMLLTRQRKH